jgi:hypothetical protein
MLRPCLSILAGLLALATAQAQLVPPATSHANSYAVLIVSRERLEAATSCEIGLFLHDQLAARLYQGQSVAFNLPPGEVSLRLQLIASGTCHAGIQQPNLQRLSLRAGEVRHYRIARRSVGLYLIATPASL